MIYRTIDIDERYQKIIKEEIKSFIERINLTTIPIVFVGGGAIVMKNFGNYNQKNISHILVVKANAKGHEYLATFPSFAMSNNNNNI
jgi:plasmid segregation protein ParM